MSLWVSKAGSVLTMAGVKELCDMVGAAGRPGQGFAEVLEDGGHHVASAEWPELSLAVPGVVVRHAEHVA